MHVTFYKKPDGRTVDLDITKVYPEDEKWFIENNVHVSMEDIGDQFVAYGDYGKERDGEPVGCMVLSGRMSCEETLHKLRLDCEEEMTKAG